MTWCLNILHYTESLNCLFQKQAFPLPLSKSGVTCLHMQPEEDLLEVMSVSNMVDVVRLKLTPSSNSSLHLGEMRQETSTAISMYSKHTPYSYQYVKTHKHDFCNINTRMLTHTLTYLCKTHNTCTVTNMAFATPVSIQFVLYRRVICITQIHRYIHTYRSDDFYNMIWWWLSPRVQESWENVRQFIPRQRFFFFKVEISSGTLIPLFTPGSVHSGSASWDDCDRVFPAE